jgi:hypothetical protein
LIFEDLYKTELSVRLNQSDTSALFTAARRKQAINDAQEEFADLTECLIKQSTIACSCNVTEYAVLSSAVLQNSTDFSRLAKAGVEYLHTNSNDYVTHLSGDDGFPRRDLAWRNRYDPHWRASTTPVQSPSGYYVREDGGSLYIGLNEPPRIGSSETGKLYVHYVARPEPMTSTSDQPFAGRADLRVYHKALPHYAAYKLLPLVGDEQGAQAALQQFLGYVARYTQSARPKGGQHVTLGRSYLRDSQRRAGRGDSDAPGYARP